MALVVIHTPPLTQAQKQRIGDRFFQALHAEGIPASSTILLFKREDADILLDGGMLVEADMGSASEERVTTPSITTIEAAPTVLQPAAPQDFKTRARRTRHELTDLKAQLMSTLQSMGHLSSFQAQSLLGLKDCEWAPATLRRLFSELEEEGCISKQGQKRGTRYVWGGMPKQVTPPPAILVKREDAFQEDEDSVSING